MSFASGATADVTSVWAISSHDIAFTERSGGITAPSTATAWVAGLAVYVPFTLTTAVTVQEWFLSNGSGTTAHNVDFGIYNMDFTKVQSLGSTAGATTASVIINTTTWTDLVLNPGSYYMAYVDDSTRNISTSTDALGLYGASGVLEQTALGSTLPNPMVPVAYTRAFLPHFGMNLYSVAL